jgi:hypothetical protein
MYRKPRLLKFIEIEEAGSGTTALGRSGASRWPNTTLGGPTSESPPDWQPRGFVFDDNGWAAAPDGLRCGHQGRFNSPPGIRRLVFGWELC